MQVRQFEKQYTALAGDASGGFSLLWTPQLEWTYTNGIVLPDIVNDPVPGLLLVSAHFRVTWQSSGQTAIRRGVYCDIRKMGQGRKVSRPLPNILSLWGMPGGFSGREWIPWGFAMRFLPLAVDTDDVINIRVEVERA